MKKVVFIDRDGTIVQETEDENVDSFEKLRFYPGSFHALRKLSNAGYPLVMVTNQDWLGTAKLPDDKFYPVHERIIETFKGEGIVFEQVFICPHAPEHQCECRKPKTGMVREYLAATKIDKERSWMIGDRETDVEFGTNIGVRSIRLGTAVNTGAELLTLSLEEAADHILRSERSAPIGRTTKETVITGNVSLDGTGLCTAKTGVGFFDHMIDQIARHSMVDIDLRIGGDLHIDEHHTVEDAGIALGEALRSALGDKKGIARFGSSAPLDEAKAEVVLDLSGRPLLVFEASFRREKVGEMPTELVKEFFKGLSDGLRATLHISVRGENDHHQIESIFKSFALALRRAIQRDLAALDRIPSTKGIL